MTARDTNHPIPRDNSDAEHLGDGAYVSHDSFQIWVSADREHQFHAVALDGLAVTQLLVYAKRIGLVR